MEKLNKYTCGEIAKSHHFLYTGDLASFSSIINDSDRNLNTVLEEFGSALDILTSSLETDFDKKCFSFKKTEQIKELYQEEVDKICDQEDRLNAVEDSLDFYIGDKSLIINLDCLLPLEEGCEQNPESYTLQQIVELFVSEVCALKDDIETYCDNLNGISGTSGTSGLP